MRRQPSVRIDLLGWKRQNLIDDVGVGQSTQRAEKEPRVGDHPLHVGIRRHDQEDRGVLRQRRDVKGRRGTGQTRKPRRGTRQP